MPACYFSGHSHWATIKHDKAKEDIKRSNLFAKLSKSISAAVQAGGSDPGNNPFHQLRRSDEHQTGGSDFCRACCEHAQEEH